MLCKRCPNGLLEMFSVVFTLTHCGHNRMSVEGFHVKFSLHGSYLSKKMLLNLHLFETKMSILTSVACRCLLKIIPGTVAQKGVM